MSDPTRDVETERFQQEAMSEAHEQTLWRDYCDARRAAEASDNIADGRYAGKAYARYMRFHLTETERQLIEAQDEIRLLRTEVVLLRERQRPSIPVPQWKDAPK